MLWLKRNLFLAVGGLLTFLALGCGGYYLWSATQEDSKIEATLQEKQKALEAISRGDPFPSTNNLSIVQADKLKLQQFITSMGGYFSPIPVKAETGQSFANALNKSTDDLRNSAKQMGVIIPGNKYAFSFEAQKDKLKFGDKTFPTVPEQLAEVKEILQILFEAKINKLVNVSRAPVSADDEAAKGPNAADYHELPISTNSYTGMTSRPYRFQFECFSTELATVLQNLTKSKYALHVKALQVEPAAPAPRSMIGTNAPGTQPIRRGTVPARGAAPAAAARGAAPAGGEMQTVLAERMLKADMVVEVIQPGK